MPRPEPTVNDAPVAVICVGDPLSPRTWSGTPSHLCEALRTRGRLGPVYDADAYAPQPFPWLARAAARVYYLGSYESARGVIKRGLRSFGVERFLRRTRPRDVLHVGSFSLPLRREDPAVSHHLFCDASWRLWLQHSEMTPRCRARLLSDSHQLERRAYRQVRSIFTTSEYVKTDLVDFYDVPQEKITVVGTGRGAIRPYHGAKDYGAGTILFVAKQRFRDKGGDILVAGFLRAAKEKPWLKLVLVGDEAYRAYTKLSPNIEVHGYASLDELQALFESAALFAMPARNEPWGLVYLEAFSCRVPVLGLDRHAFPELTKNGKFGFAANEPTGAAIAAALLDAFSDTERLAAMGRAAQEYCLAHFTWEETVQRMLQVIDSQSSPDAGR